MRTYFEVQIPIDVAEHMAEVVIARLDAMGFDGFVEETDHLLAYRLKGEDSAMYLGRLLSEAGISYSRITEIADENWNATWEAQYEPVSVAGRILVRAPFHPRPDRVEYDIVIEPKMSFGTAHHETTSMMLELILGVECRGKAVLDMGCGTGVLAIFAHMRGADPVTAIDNDEWAFNNAQENASLNGAPGIRVMQGDAASIAGMSFAIIFANINRNILMEDIPAYAEALDGGGELLISGFYEDDLGAIREKCLSSGLAYGGHISKNRWVAAMFKKI